MFASRPATVAVAAGLALLATTAIVTPAAAASPISCQYTFASWPGGFFAEVKVVNSGPDINGWTVHWTFGVPTAIIANWQTNLTVRDGVDASATNAVYNAVIRSGSALSFGWSATAAATSAPTDLTVNGTAC